VWVVHRAQNVNDVVQIHRKSCGSNLFRYLEPPALSRIKFDEHNARIVGRNLDTGLEECAHAFSPKLSDKKSQFEDHVLPGARLLGVKCGGCGPSAIILCQQNDRESNV
jgi:hypothetical protein